MGKSTTRGAASLRRRHAAPDITLERLASLAFLVPLSAAGREWVAGNVSAEPWQWHGGGLAIDLRYADDVNEAVRAGGLTVKE